MNTANLQLEGLYIVLAAVLRTLRDKGALSADEIEAALDQAEISIASDCNRVEELSAANLEAICFPIRLLRIANAASGGRPPSFTELATAVGRRKPDHQS